MADDERSPKRFSVALRDHLVMSLVTPSRLAEAIEVRSGAVHSWINGISVPAAETVWAIAYALQVPVDDLMASAVVENHRKTRIANDALGGVSLIKAADSYLANLGVLERLPKQDRAAFLQAVARTYVRIRNGSLKPSIIADSVKARENRGTTPRNGESAPILLPAPPVELIDPWLQLLREVANGGEALFSLHWRQFENFVARVLEEYGWETTPMAGSRDGGIDIVAARTIAPGIPFRMMVQCKRHGPGRKVGVEVVREVWSVKWEGGFHQAMIATTTGFTAGAAKQGSAWDLALEDQARIVTWCQDLAGIKI